MAAFLNITRWLVGILFIFSGLVKLNDPLGTAIKMEEYFEVFANDISPIFHYLTPQALAVGLIVIILEVLLGVALLINFKIKTTAWMLLVIIVFFTFLTFYSAAFEKVTDCGCFGDAIPLNPWQSFLKDVVLLVLIGIIFFKRNSLKPLVGAATGGIITGVTLVICVLLAYIAIEHLPFIDFRPYKIGVDISKAMQPSAEYRYKYLMEKDGKIYEFEQYPMDNTYEFRKMILLNPEAEPKITDYHIWNDDGDFTDESLEGIKLFLVFPDVNKARVKRIPGILTLAGKVNTIIETWVVMANDEETYEHFRHEHQIPLPYFYADGTVLKTMIRANPGIILLKDGVVLGKWHNNDLPTQEKLEQLIQ